MATSNNISNNDSAKMLPVQSGGGVWDKVVTVLRPLASLKLTVFLLVLAVFATWVVTLEQNHVDFWHVKKKNFASPYVKIPFSMFFIPKWAPSFQSIPGSFVMPSGFTIIVALLVNLMAAHLIRFKLQAKGSRLVMGLVATLFTTVLTWAVVFHGQSAEGFQKEPPITYRQMWMCMQVALLACALAAGAGLVMVSRERKVERIVLGLFALLFGSTLAATLILGEKAFIGDSGMRIVWQLAQSTVAALAGLGACVLLFRKRAGIVLLHIGIAGLLINEIFVTVTNVESQIAISEGESISVSEDIRTRELAIIDRSDDEFDSITVVPGSKLIAGRTVDDESLPFRITVEAYYPNSSIGPVAPNAPEAKIATKGFGTQVMATQKPVSTGIEMNTPPDMAAAYVTLTDKKDGAELGTFLFSQQLFGRGFVDTIEAGDKSYQVGLRYKTQYKPYTLKLLDVQKIDYVGTDTPKWFSSDITLTDHEKETKVDQKIWMNNPLRYADETLYQSSYGQFEDGTEYSILQVVRNRGWMIPYVCCMFTFVGLIWQFGLSLLAYLEKDRRQVALDMKTAVGMAVSGGMDIDVDKSKSQPAQKKLKPGAKTTATIDDAMVAKVKASQERAHSSRAGWLVPLLLVLFFGGYVASKMSRGARESVVIDEMEIGKFGQIPITFDGRVQPLDSLARNTARQLCNREEVKTGAKRKMFGLFNVDVKVPAIQWLVDTIYEKEGFENYRIIRIEDLNVIQAMRLTPRKGLLYSLREVQDGLAVKSVKEMVSSAREKGSNASSGMENRLVQVDGKLNLIYALRMALADNKYRLKNEDDILERLQAGKLVAPTSTAKLPLMVPSDEEGEPWVGMSTALNRQWLAELAKKFDDSTVEGLAKKINEAEFKEVFPNLREEMIKNQVTRNMVSSPAMLNMLKEATGLESAEEITAQMKRNWDQFPEQILADQMKIVGPMVDAEIKMRRNQIDELTVEQVKSINGLDKDTIEPVNDLQLNHLAELEPAFRRGDAPAFNEALSAYLASLKKKPPVEMRSSGVAAEKVYNGSSPFHWSMFLYLIAGLLAVLAWTGYSQPLNRASFWLIILGLSIQTIGIVLRVVISGRAPVTNLYSSYVFVSAVFILINLIVERRTKTGVGNLMAAVGGFSALMWAWSMSIADGDTFTVMRAVLDTQFWLSTHVVCISLGYSTTVAAGFLGAAYIVKGLLTPSLTAEKRKTFGNLIYGIVCFGLLFSFFGTVLGGLWADDSWGRFWGWDPKENGALMIVLWNAVILHARWAGLIKNRGMATLAVMSSIITVWSWEAVNQMGVGLHAYGGSGGGRMQWICWFWAVNAVIFAMGLIPTKFWLSHVSEKAAKA